MTDFLCEIKFWRDDIELHIKVVQTIEEDINIEDTFEREETIRDILLEKLKEEFDEDVKLIEFETIINNDYDIYKLTY